MYNNASTSVLAIILTLWTLTDLKAAFATDTPDLSGLLMAGRQTPLYPLSIWMDRLNPEFGSFGALAVPHGESSQSGDTDFESPRTVLGMVELGNKNSAKFDVWLAYARHAKEQVHAIICREGDESCRFFTVEDYRPSANAVVNPITDPQTCLRCHTSAGPLSVTASANSNLQTKKRLQATPHLDPVANWAMRLALPASGNDVETYFDEWITREYGYMAWAKIRHGICENRLDCRQAILLSTLFAPRAFGELRDQDLDIYLSGIRGELEPLLIREWPKVAYSLFRPYSGNRKAIEPLGMANQLPDLRGSQSPTQIQEKIWATLMVESKFPNIPEFVIQRAKARGFASVLRMITSPKISQEIESNWPLSAERLDEILRGS